MRKALFNIRNLGRQSFRVLAVFKKNTSEKIYTSIKYVAKKVPLDKLDLLDELKNKISLEEYREK